MDTAAALEVIERADAQLTDFNDPKVAIADETFARTAEALGASLHPRYEALLRSIGGGDDNAMWAASTDGDLWAPHPQLGRGLVDAAREAWAEASLATFCLSPLTASATTGRCDGETGYGARSCGCLTTMWAGRRVLFTRMFWTGP